MRNLFHRSSVTAAFLVFIMLGFFSASVAGGLDIGRISLKGLKGLHVAVRTLKPEIQNEGLTRKIIEKDVESRLNDAGIKTLTAMECFSTAGGPSLDVDVKASKLKSGSEKSSGYIYTIDVRLAQGVTLDRDSMIALHADTWKTQDYGQVSKLEELRNKIKEKIDEFARSYKAANSDKAAPGMNEPKPVFTEPETIPRSK
ncbi:MAG: hypothetical protein JW883_12605 [Deltaproteobacteria bacterium]|nr:hypothetical protein [Deltaproteobacteria bacterium]